MAHELNESASKGLLYDSNVPYTCPFCWKRLVDVAWWPKNVDFCARAFFDCHCWLVGSADAEEKGVRDWCVGEGDVKDTWFPKPLCLSASKGPG